MKPRSNNDLVTSKISIMNVLFILLYFQFSGIIVSFLQSYIRNSIDNRKIITNTKKLIFQKRKNEQWLIDYFQEHPKKIFKQNFPEIYKLSVAINYDVLSSAIGHLNKDCSNCSGIFFLKP